MSLHFLAWPEAGGGVVVTEKKRNIYLVNITLADDDLEIKWHNETSHVII